jgi:hypothetical protein
VLEPLCTQAHPQFDIIQMFINFDWLSFVKELSGGNGLKLYKLISLFKLPELRFGF